MKDGLAEAKKIVNNIDCDDFQKHLALALERVAIIDQQLLYILIARAFLFGAVAGIEKVELKLRGEDETNT